MHVRNQVNLGTLFLMGVLACVGTRVSLGKTVYVTPNGNDGNTGLDWETAKQTVQAGLNTAVSGDQVWVAAGTYVQNITLNAGVALYGGFAGGEDPATFDLADRDLAANETILDGNQAGTVVTSPSAATATTRIDGFTIRNGTFGIYCDYSSPTIANNTITGNSAYYGGGICCDSSSPTIANNTITGNSARTRGGGIYCFYSSPTIANNTITGNSVTNGNGGGIYCEGGSPEIANNTIAANSATYDGGGIYCYYYSSPTVTNCMFSGNSAGNYGGGLVGSSSNLLLMECMFTGNSAHQEGGGIWIEGGSGHVSLCRLVGNSAGGDGGAVLNRADNLVISHCLFAGNWAFDFGGGISNVGGNLSLTVCAFVGNCAAWGGGVENWTGTANLVNCSFALNEAAEQGHDLYGWNSSHTTLANSIVWGQSGPTQPIVLALSAGLVVRYSDVRGGPAGVSRCPQCSLSWEQGNINAEPQFVDPDGPDDLLGTDDDNLALIAGSPCIDAAENSRVPADVADLDGDGDVGEKLPFDLDGHPRFMDDPATTDTGVPLPPDYVDIVDMGAFEFIPPIPGDFDRDGDLDGDDLAVFQACVSGPAVAYTGDCAKADFDPDGDVDQSDFGLFQRCYSGPHNPADPACMN